MKPVSEHSTRPVDLAPKISHKALTVKPPKAKTAAKIRLRKSAGIADRILTHPAPRRFQPASNAAPALSSRQLLQSLKALPEATTSLNQRESAIFLNPTTQRLYDQALQNRGNPVEPETTDQKLTVDDKSPVIDGFRYSVIDGRCWAVPIEDGFDNFSTPLMMQDFNCPQEDKTPLAEHLQKWIQKNQ